MLQKRNAASEAAPEVKESTYLSIRPMAAKFQISVKIKKPADREDRRRKCNRSVIN
jgi:hypothetical protein